MWFISTRKADIDVVDVYISVSSAQEHGILFRSLCPEFRFLLEAVQNVNLLSQIYCVNRFFVLAQSVRIGWWLNVSLRNPKSTLSIST